MCNVKISNNEFAEIIKQSHSIRQVLKKLNVSPRGGNYIVFKKRVEKLNIDTSHFKGQGWRSGKHVPKRNIHEYLSNKVPIGSYRLRNRLIKEKMIENKCQQCNLTSWLGKSISLELHHIDGNVLNNNLNNLELLCPNCHSLTSNHRRSKRSLKD